jgi:hypothetical protein
MIDVLLITPGSIFPALCDRRDLLDKLVQKDADRATPDALIGMIFRQNLSVYGVFLEHKLVGFALASVCHYAKGRALVVHDVVTDTGVFEDHWERLFNLLGQTAKNTGCAWVDFHGRPGWNKWAKESGFEARQVVFTKPVQ